MLASRRPIGHRVYKTHRFVAEFLVHVVTRFIGSFYITDNSVFSDNEVYEYRTFITIVL